MLDAGRVQEPGEGPLTVLDCACHSAVCRTCAASGRACSASRRSERRGSRASRTDAPPTNHRPSPPSPRSKGHQSSFTRVRNKVTHSIARCTHVEPTPRRLGGCCFLALQPVHRKEHAVHRRLRVAVHLYVWCWRCRGAVLTTRSPRLDHHFWSEYATPIPMPYKHVTHTTQTARLSTCPSLVFQRH